MPRFPKPKNAKRGKAPPPALYVNPDSLDLHYVEVLDIVQEKKMIAGKAKTCTYFYAVYDPPLSLLRAQFGPTCQRDGTEQRVFPYDTKNNNPRFLVVWCPRVRFNGDDKVVYGLARPAGFNNGRRCHDELERVVRELLAESSVAQIRRATGLSRPRIKGIGAEMVKEYLDDLRDSDCAPLFLAIDVVDPGSRKGQKNRKGASKPLLMVTGSDPRRGQKFFLGLLEMPPGATEWTPQTPIVRALKDILLALPYPEDLLAVALDGENRLRNLMQAALDSAARQNPAFQQVRFVLDRWHVILNCAKALAELRNKLRREEGPQDEAFSKALWHAKDLDKKHWAMIPPQRQKELKRLLGQAQELRELHQILMAVRSLFRLPNRTAAAEAIDALCNGLTKLQQPRLQNFLDYMNEHREQFLTYFDMKQETLRRYGKAYSMTSGLAEAMNGQVKQRCQGGANVSLEILRAQMIAAYGYPAVAARAALKAKERCLRTLRSSLQGAARAVGGIATEAERQERTLRDFRGVDDALKPSTLLKDCVVSLRDLPVVARHGPQLRQ